MINAENKKNSVRKRSGRSFIIDRTCVRSKVCGIEIGKLIEGNYLILAAVIKVCMRCAGNNEQFLVGCVLAVHGHICVSVLAEVAGMSLVTVYDEDGAAYLV